MAIERGGLLNVDFRLLGVALVQQNLNEAIARIEQRTQAGVLEAALYIRGEAQKLTPLVSGNLRASAFVSWASGVKTRTPIFKDVPIYPAGVAQQRMTEWTSMTEASVARTKIAQFVSKDRGEGLFMVNVGFSAIYAIKVHENPIAGKTGGISPAGYAYRAGRTTSGKRSQRKMFSTVGQWKFLEDAVKNNMLTIVSIILNSATVGKGK
jgi:hypothetical protein